MAGKLRQGGYLLLSAGGAQGTRLTSARETGEGGKKSIRGDTSSAKKRGIFEQTKIRVKNVRAVESLPMARGDSKEGRPLDTVKKKKTNILIGSWRWRRANQKERNRWADSLPLGNLILSLKRKRGRQTRTE